MCKYCIAHTTYYIAHRGDNFRARDMHPGSHVQGANCSSKVIAIDSGYHTKIRLTRAVASSWLS